MNRQTKELSQQLQDQEGIYHIRVRHSGQYIDVKNASTAAGTQAVQFNYNGGMNQQYRLLPYDGTYYQLEPVHAPGKVLAKSGTNDRGFSILSLEASMSGRSKSAVPIRRGITGEWICDHL